MFLGSLKLNYLSDDMFVNNQSCTKELVEFAMKKRFETIGFRRNRFFLKYDESEKLHEIYVKLGMYTKRKNTTITDFICSFENNYNKDVYCIFEIRSKNGKIENRIRINQEDFEKYGYLIGHKE